VTGAIAARFSAVILAVLVCSWGCMNGSVLNALKAAEAGPAAPKSIGIVVGSGQATISWPAVPGTDSYNLYWAAGTSVSISSGTKIPDAVSPQTITGLSNGTPYAFMVTSVNNYRESAAGTLAAVTPGAAPAAPTISSRSPGERQVTVNWPTVAGAASYNLYWKQGSTVDTSTGTKIAGATSPQVINDPSMTDGTQYSFIVTAVDSFGESAASTTVNVTTNLYALYVPNAGSNNVSAFKINSSTGALSSISGSPFGAGTGPNWVAVDPTGSYAYVTNYGDYTVSAYAINPANGALGAVSGSPYGTNAYPEGVVVDPTGRFVYVSNFGRGSGTTISEFTILAGSGALAAVSGSPVGTGSGPTGVAIDPAGKFYYVSNWVNDNVYTYTINSSTGALTYVSATAAGAQPYAGAVDPAGPYVYVANYNSNTVSEYSLNSSTGTLTALTSSSIGTGSLPYSVAIDPAGKFAYVANFLSNSISAFTINSGTGALSPITGSPFAAGTGPMSVVVDPTGKFLYAANNGSNNISAYTIDPVTGALSAVTGQPFAAGTGPNPLAATTIRTP
jgi:6-phosphogluconolactonase